MNSYKETSVDMVVRHCARASVACIACAFISGVYYALNVSVLQDGTFYEPEFILSLSRVLAIAGISLAGYAIWRWTDARQ